MAQTSEEDKQRPRADTYADLVERKCWLQGLHPTQEGPPACQSQGLHPAERTSNSGCANATGRQAPCGGLRAVERSVPREPGSPKSRAHRPTEAACLPSSVLHTMLIPKSSETPKFGGGGGRHPNPRSRYGARPCPAAERTDPISLWPSIETAYRLRRLSMQEAASLCGTTRCGGRRSAPGGFVGRFRSVERGYAVSCKRASEDSPSRSVAWLNKLACKGPQAAVPSGRAGASSDSPEDAL
jgi:hypothetical protein